VTQRRERVERRGRHQGLQDQEVVPARMQAAGSGCLLV
jgi:hypothetical protein